MRRLITVITAALLGAATLASAEGVSASLDIASAYVFRGSTFNDGVVAQPGLEVSGLPVTIGVWGNLNVADYDGAVEGGEFSEIDLYASYDLPLDMEVLGLSVGYCEYTYPSIGGDADRELSLSLSLELPLAPSLGVYYGVGGVVQDAFYAELGLGHEFSLAEKVSLELSGALGYAAPDGGESGLSHANVSAGVNVGFVSATVTYVGRIDEDVLPDVADGGLYDTEVLGVLGVAGDF